MKRTELERTESGLRGEDVLGHEILLKKTQMKGMGEGSLTLKKR